LVLTVLHYEHSDTKNRILKALPLKEYRLVMAQLKPVELAQEVVLYDASERIRDVIFQRRRQSPISPGRRTAKLSRSA